MWWVEHPLEHHPYSALKQSLLDSHQLTYYQKIATLHKMELLGGRKPSELLTSKLELCPQGHESFFFLSHLLVVYSVSFLDPYIFNKEGKGLCSDLRGGSKTWQMWADLKKKFVCQLLLPPPPKFAI